MRKHILVGCYLVVGWADRATWALEHAAPAGAGEDATSIITAERARLGYEILSAGTQVLEDEDLQAWRGLSWPELLGQLTLLDVRQRGPSQADVSLRGAGFEQVLIVVDGIPLADIQTGHHNLDLPIAPGDIQRIVIRTGGSSSLYGPGAMGGVIEITTRRGFERRLGTALRGGSFSSLSLDADWGGTGLASWGQAGALSIAQSAGHRAGTDAQSWILSQAATWIHPQGRLLARVGATGKRFGADGFYGVYPSYEETRTLVAYLVDDWQPGEHWSLRMQASFRRHDDLYLLVREAPEKYEAEHTGTGGLLGMALGWQGFSWGQGSLGLEWAGDGLESNKLGDHERFRQAVVVEHSLSLGQRWRLWTGGRWDLWSGDSFGNLPSWGLGSRLGLAERLDLVASLGSGFRLPSFTELFTATPANQGDSKLGPEKSTSLEVSLQWRFSDTMRLSIGGFGRRDENLVDWVKAADDKNLPWRAMNISRLDALGGEVRLNWSPARQLTIDLRYTRLDLQGEKKAMLSKYVFRQPIDDLGVVTRHLIGQTWRLSASLRALRRPDEGFHVQEDLRLGYLFPRGELTIEARNLFDETSPAIPGALLPGKSIFLGLALEAFD